MQSKRDSLIESVTDTIIGYILGIFITLLNNYIHEIDVPVWKNFTMPLLFVGISIARRYVLRRWFNKKEKKTYYVIGVDPYKVDIDPETFVDNVKVFKNYYGD